MYAPPNDINPSLLISSTGRTGWSFLKVFKMLVFKKYDTLCYVCLCSRGLELSRSHTPDMERAGPSPTMQQRIKAIGVPTPLAMSSPLRR